MGTRACGVIDSTIRDQRRDIPSNRGQALSPLLSLLGEQGNFVAY
jgi:hypothetical protein